MINAYLKANRKWVILWLLIQGTLYLTYYLYEVPLEIIHYTLVLIGFFTLIVVAIDLLSQVKKHRALRDWMKNTSINPEMTIKTDHIIEKDYIEIVNRLVEEKNNAMTTFDAKQSDVLDYYTLWMHQIKTPISALDLMIQSETSSKEAMALELFKIEEYVAMALNYLRLDSTSTDYVFKKCSVDACIKKAVRKYRKVFIEKRIKLTYEEQDHYLITDEKWLVFVLEQILSNALKYTSSGGITILSEQRAITIIDTGCGIKAEDLPRVFEKGFTGYNGRMSSKSTGIGLYLCKRIASNLSMDLIIESEVAQGTRVKLTYM